MSSRHVPIHQFQSLTGLSDKAVLYLLKHKLLRCSLDQDGSLMVDIESTETKALQDAILHRQQETLQQHHTLISERLGTIVRDELESIVDEAVARLLAEQD